MLEITIPGSESFDERTMTFNKTEDKTIALEHSLVSLSKWESKWCKPFLTSEKTYEETVDYIRCMTITKNVDPKIYYNLTTNNIKAIKDYMAAPMTATTVNHRSQTKGRSREILTAEVIYYYMISLNIPFECQKWHLNRLFKLIEVCSVKSAPPKKMKKGDIMRRNAALNAQRRAQLNTTG